MPPRTGHTSIPIAAGSALAIAATVVFSIVMIRLAPGPVVSGAGAGDAAEGAPAPVRGVRATLSAGETTVERALPALSFHLEPGQSLDSRLAPGPFTGRFRLGFSSGSVRYARVGAWVRGGSLYVRRHGRLIADDHAGDEPRLVLSTEPIFLGSRLQEIEYEIEAAGDGPVAVRAVWQPEGAQIPVPLPGDGTRLLSGPADRGLVAVQELNCIACHETADPTLATLLDKGVAPDLEAVAGRVRPSWFATWLADPPAVVPGTRMPRLFDDGDADAEAIEDLAHFLASRGGPLDADDASIDPGPVASGQVLYHRVGCVACHGPLDGSDAGNSNIATLPDLHAKTTVDALAAFLRDPVAVRPAGLMPSLALDETEAGSIASYLLSRHEPPAAASWTPDPDRVERGRAAFASRGCAACHETTGPDAIVSTLAAPPLESVDPAAPGGCLSATPGPGVPAFALSPSRRDAVAAFLSSLPQRVARDVPIERVASTVHRLRCLSCHGYYGDGGPGPGLAGWFTTEGEADLGDEGRLPPVLSGVGARLDPPWIRQVLEDGARARPYLATRMPQYGAANVAGLPADFCRVAGVPERAGDGPPFDVEAAASGRELVGAGGLNCIQCHDIAGRPATGTPGPDLAAMTERLRFEGFARWLHDPALTRPGTRMPSFFVGGRGAFTQHYGGDASEQIRAIWCYLSQGEMLALPEGLVDPQGLVLDITGDEPLVFRTFMQDAGVRAIACGFPEQVHCAFDADRCRMAAAWQGPFLNASGAWAARGGTETNPVELAWTAPDEPVFAGGWTYHFRGYRLDERRRPIFEYELRDGDRVVRVGEQPVPRRDGLAAWLVRRFELDGPPGLTLGADGRDVTLDDSGHAAFEMEIRWETDE